MRPTNEQAENLIGLYFPVLDYGFCSLVDYMGTDQCIERMARVSYGAGTRKKSLTRGLLRYLRRHRHTSPFEGVELKFHISMPIFVMRQFVRHRTASLNEISGRYSLLPMLFYTPETSSFQKQSSNNKQGRDEKLEETKYKAAVFRWNELRDSSQSLYRDLLAGDVARELSRIDLPLSTYTQFYWKVNLHNLMHLLNLRCDSHAQFEIRAYANVLAGIVKEVAPLSFEAWFDYDFCSESFSRMELEALNKMMSEEVSDDELKNMGLSKREIEEFKQKLTPKEYKDFSLDHSQAKNAEYFQELMDNNIPDIDRKKH